MTATAEIDVNAEIAREPRAAPFIIDADAHVNPPPTMWESYLPKRTRDLAPKIEHDDDCDWVVFEGARKKINLIAAQAGREGKYKIQGKLSDARMGGWMAPARSAPRTWNSTSTASRPTAAGSPTSAAMTRSA